MKLLAVSTSCWSASNREFYRRLSATGHQVTIVIPSIWNFGSKTVPAEPKLPIDPHIEFLEPTNFHQRLYRLKGLKAIIQKWKPEVIYFEGDPGSLMCAMLGGLAKKQGAKLVALSCENLSQSPLDVVKREGGKQFLNALIKYSLIQFSKKKIDCLFVINREGLAYFKKLGFKKVVKTPLGFDENFFNINDKNRVRIREKLGISQNNIVIAYFGRLVYEKGLHLMIEALEKLELDNFNLLIDKFSRYADPYQMQVYDSIMSSSLKENTLFFEAEHLEIADYMNASDIAILPSISTKTWLEQYGRVVPEAKACGSLVIVSDVGAPKDFFEEGYPFIFKSGSRSDLQKKLELAITTIKKAKYNKHTNSKKAIQNYSLPAQVKLFMSHVIES
jgi:glycosyltransferase involved in cell wall biosynthesis